jgi:aminopeptidase N
VTQNPHRLGRDVLPERYDLVLEPDLAAASFTGSVAIEVTVVDAVDEIVLNADELDIARVLVDGSPAPFRLEPRPSGW